MLLDPGRKIGYIFGGIPGESFSMKKILAFWAAVAIVGTALPPPVSAGTPAFPSLRESGAYQQFKLRPVSDLSRLIFLIDRFSDTGVEILYDGSYYKAKFAARIALWFLSTHYKKETPEQWIMRWCNVSVPANNLIWVKLPGGKVRLAREVLMEELKALDRALAEDAQTTDSQILKMAPTMVTVATASSTLKQNG